MSRDVREFLEEIAADRIFLSMEYIGVPYEEMIEETRTMSDDELLKYVLEV